MRSKMCAQRRPARYHRHIATAQTRHKHDAPTPHARARERRHRTEPGDRRLHDHAAAKRRRGAHERRARARAGAVRVRHVRHRVLRASDRLSFIFGHFGDRIGRKSTLVASPLVMGLSTTLIGLVPGYGLDRQSRTDPLVHPALRTGHRTRRRMGRRGAARDRICAQGQARAFRHVPATRAVDRFSRVERILLRARAVAVG